MKRLLLGSLLSCMLVGQVANVQAEQNMSSIGQVLATTMGVAGVGLATKAYLDGKSDTDTFCVRAGAVAAVALATYAVTNPNLPKKIVDGIAQCIVRLWIAIQS